MARQDDKAAGESTLIEPLAVLDERLDLRHAVPDPKRPDVIRRFELANPQAGPIRISADVRTEGVAGPPGGACMVFFNVEYTEGPVFWDMFLYPDTGTTPWRILSCAARDRGAIRAVEMHIRFQSSGRLLLRDLRVETLAPWDDAADLAVAIFGDSTDMTNYLPTEFRLGRRLELLLRDRFPESRIDVHCLAEGGETLQRLLGSGRLDRELRCLPRCDVALIRYGLNDTSRGVDPVEFGKQLQTASETIHARFPRAQVVLSTTIPPNAAAYDRQTAAMAETLRLPLIRLDEFIRQRSAAGDSDWHHQPGSRIGRRREANPPGNPDGLEGDKHPNAYGAQMIAEHYFQHLEPVVAARLAALQQGRR